MKRLKLNNIPAVKEESSTPIVEEVKNPDDLAYENEVAYNPLEAIKHLCKYFWRK